MYWVIHLNETDGDIVLWPCKDGPSVVSYLKLMGLHREDYAIIEGLKLKDFNNVSFNHKNLKRSQVKCRN